MPKRLITQAAFARQVGVKPSTISKSLKQGNLKRAAVGTKIDIDHSAAKLFIKNHAKGKTLEAKAEGKLSGGGSEQADNVDLSQIPNDIAELADESLRKLVEVFGTDSRFLDWLKALKAIEDVREKRLKNEVAEGSMISREFVETHVFGFIEGVLVQLLNDAPRTITARAIESVEAEETREVIEKTVQEILSKNIKNLKAKVTRALKNA